MPVWPPCSTVSPSTEFWINGEVNEEIIDLAYSKIPSPDNYTCSLSSFNEPIALQRIWESLRTATFDYSARSHFIMPPPALIVTKVFLILREIGPSKIPGTTIARRHEGLVPDKEFARRNRCALSYKQDANAIAALTGPIARLLGPSGFKVEEVLVRTKKDTRLEEYVFQEGWGASYRDEDVVQQDLELLVFKATSLKDPTRVYAIAPTGVRFGWNFTTMEWNTFVAKYTTNEVWTARLGRTREDLDRIALENMGDGNTATLPRSVVKLMLGRDMRIELREVLNRFCEKKGYLWNPERMLEDHEELDQHVQGEMEVWMKQWRRDYRRKRHQQVLKQTLKAPSKFARSLKHLPHKFLRGLKRITGKAASASELVADRYSDFSGDEIDPLLGSRPSTADSSRLSTVDSSRPSTADSFTRSNALGMRDGNGGVRSALRGEREDQGEGSEDRSRAGALEWAPDVTCPVTTAAPFSEAESTPNTTGLLNYGWPSWLMRRENQYQKDASAVAGASASAATSTTAGSEEQQRTQPSAQTQQQTSTSSNGSIGSIGSNSQQTSQAPTTSTSHGKRVSWLDLHAQEPGYSTMSLSSENNIDTGADPQASTAAGNSAASAARTAGEVQSLSTIEEEPEGGSDAPWDSETYASWDPWVRHWFWWEISDVYRQLAGEKRVGPVAVPAVVVTAPAEV